EGGTRLEEAVLDVGAKRVQRHPALAVELGAAHLGAAEAAGDLHPNAFDQRVLHRRLDGLTHRAAEADPAGQLLGNALGNQLRVRLGVLHLEDVQLHLLAGELLQLGADPVGLGTLAADDDARTRGVDVDADPVPGALDVHLGDAGTLQAPGHQLADLDILSDVVLVELVRVPAALPVGGDAEPEPVRVNLLAHYSAPSSEAAAFFAGAFFAAFLAGAASVDAAASAGAASVAGAALVAAFAGAAFAGRAGAAATTLSTAMVMWQVRLRMRYARP